MSADEEWLSPEQERAWRRYRRMRTLLDLAVSRDLRADSGLSDADYDVLSTLSEHEDHRWRARDLAGRLLWSTSRLAHHVGRMERRGLVARSSIDDDARGALVSLTPAGWDALQRAAPPHVASVRRHLLDHLTASDVRALDRIAGRVVAALEEHPPLAE